MKKLLPNGSEIIVGNGLGLVTGTHDAWPTHAQGTPFDEPRMNTSGQWIWGIWFTLKDDSQFFYVYSDEGTNSEINDDEARLYRPDFPIPGGPWIGENFNFDVRYGLRNKWTAAELATWQAT